MPDLNARSIPELPFTPRLFGARVLRREDRRLLDGSARYLDDICRPNMVHISFVRSPIAHARILSVNLGTLASMSSTCSAFTASDLGSPVPAVAANSRTDGFQTSQMPVLASGKVRYVGEPIAVVAADSPYEAEDFAELVAVDFDGRPPVVDPITALGDGSARVHDEWSSNIYLRRHRSAGDLDAARRASTRTICRRFEPGVRLGCQWRTGAVWPRSIPAPGN